MFHQFRVRPHDRPVLDVRRREGHPLLDSTSAMDELEGVGRAASSEREAQFMRLRARIEARATVKYMAGEFEGVPAGIIPRSIDFRTP
ncbi:DUF1488 domain-containing protein [Bradyrhizobium sp. USDA 3256]